MTDQDKAAAVYDWLFAIEPGDTESRAEMIVKTCRDWRRTQDRARDGVRVTVAVLGLVGGWAAGLGETVKAFFASLKG